MKTKFLHFNFSWHLVFVFLAYTQNVKANVTVTIPSGSGYDNGTNPTQAFPYGTTSAYMYSVSLYTIDEIGYSGNITKVYWPNKNGFNAQTQTIYLKYTTATTLNPSLTFTNYITGATQVNSSTIGTNTGVNTLTFTLGTAFPYDATQNLLVIVKSVRSSGSNNDPQVQYNTSNSRHIQWSSASDPSASTGTLTNNRPNFGFDMTSATALACGDGNCYCIPTYTNGSDKFNSFTTTGGYNNIADNDNTTGAYKNKYASQTVEVMANSSFNFSSPSYTGANVQLYIWVDWNKNNMFESGEAVFSQYGSGSNPSFSGTINVPNGQADGNYRMRVRGAYLAASGTLNPCGNYSYGQTRDYKVAVITPTCTGKPTGGTLTISPSTGAPGSTANGTVSGATPYEPGISYWWESSSDGTTWSTISGQTSASLSVAQAGTQDLYYRRITKCIVSGDTARSTIAMYSTFTTDWPSFSAWFKSEDGSNITVSGGKVSSWIGTGTPGITVTSPSANQPTLIDGATNYKQFNYHDRVKFDASSSTYLWNNAPNTGLLGSDGGTIFGAFNNISTDATDFFYSPSALYQLKVGFRYQSSSGSSFNGYTREFTGTAPPTTELSNASSRIITGWGINVTAGRVRGGKFNGVDITSFIDNSSTYTPKIYANRFVFGKRIANDGTDNLEKSDNAMAEFIMMNTPATANQRNIIETYLALKYGNTRGNNSGTSSTYNYISTKGTTIYDKSANTGFTNDIAGIGRDDVSGLNQKQSISVNVTDPVTVSLGSGAIPNKIVLIPIRLPITIHSLFGEIMAKFRKQFMETLRCIPICPHH